MTTSPISGKKHLPTASSPKAAAARNSARSAKARRPACDLPPNAADLEAGMLLDYALKVAKWMVEQIMVNPSDKPETANARARDVRTMNELMRSIERIDRVKKQRATDRRKPRTDDESEIKSAIARKLDRIVDAERARRVPGEPQPR